MTRPVGELADLIAADFEQAKSDTTDHRLQERLLTALADAGGALPTEELLAVALQHIRGRGAVADAAASQAVAALLAQPDDKRKSSLVTSEVYGKLHACVLTSGGWSAAGYPSQRYRKPAASQLDHRWAILTLHRWLEQRLAPELERRYDAYTTVTSGMALRAEMTQRAEGLKRAFNALDDPKAAVPLLGGVYPDLLVTTCHPADNIDHRNERLWPITWGRDRDGDLDIVWAAEVEYAGKNVGAMTRKVRNLSLAATATPEPFWHAVLWVVRSATIARLIRRTVEAVELRPIHETPHYITTAASMGIGDPTPEIDIRWPEAVELGLLDEPPTTPLDGLFS